MPVWNPGKLAADMGLGGTASLPVGNPVNAVGGGGGEDGVALLLLPSPASGVVADFLPRLANPPNAGALGAGEAEEEGVVDSAGLPKFANPWNPVAGDGEAFSVPLVVVVVVADPAETEAAVAKDPVLPRFENRPGPAGAAAVVVVLGSAVFLGFGIAFGPK